MRSGIGTIVYLIVGVVVAASHHYFTHASTLIIAPKLMAESSQ